MSPTEFGSDSNTLMSNLVRRRSFLKTGGLAALIGFSKESPAITRADGAIVNVTTTGAKGDGLNDDTDSIQRAINIAQDLAFSGIVYLPVGRYRITRSLKISKPVCIRGEGQITINGGTQILLDGLDFDGIVATNVNFGIVLEGFDFFGFPSGKPGGGVAIRLQGCQNVELRQIKLCNIWSGLLVDSSGAVVVTNMIISAVDLPGLGRFGVKCTAHSPGNPNGTTLINVVVGQYSAQNPRTMDGFVLAKGYNSLTCIQCGALGGNRAFWSTNEGGEKPNFFVANTFTSDHCSEGVRLDDGVLSQFEQGVVTSSFIRDITVGEAMRGPVSFTNCHVVSTSGPAFSIEGGEAVHINGAAIEILNSHGIYLSSRSTNTRVLISATTIAHTGLNGLHIAASFRGRAHWEGVLQHKGRIGLFAELGMSGKITGIGSFEDNLVADADYSGGTHPKNSITVL